VEENLERAKRIDELLDLIPDPIDRIAAVAYYDLFERMLEHAISTIKENYCSECPTYHLNRQECEIPCVDAWGLALELTRQLVKTKIEEN